MSGWRHTKWRKPCPRCGRMTAVTWDQRDGVPYLVRHHDPATRTPCARSGKATTRDGLQ